MSRLKSVYAEMHNHLKNDYLDETGTAIDSCERIQLRLIDLLKSEGKPFQRHIIWGVEFETLIPTPFNGRVQWGAHYICSSSGVVYDPMLPEPMPMDTYVKEGFHQPIEIEDY